MEIFNKVIMPPDEEEEKDLSQKRQNLEKMTAAYRTILEVISGSVFAGAGLIVQSRCSIQCVCDRSDSKGLEDTPLRAAKAMQFLTSGNSLTTVDVVGTGVFTSGVEGNMVIVKDIDIHSICEHHLLPFIGKVE